MIIVTGSVVARPDTDDAIEQLSIEHVRRSRTEPGCLLHSVHRDVENEHRFVFIEHWASLDDLHRHFAVPESGRFVTAVTELAAGPPTIEVFDATPRA